MSVVMEWVKTNVFIVIFALLMISALVILPILSSSMNSGISKTVSERVKLVSDLKALGKKDVEPPQAAKPVQGVPALVNEKLLEAYRQLGTEMRSDADAVIASALAFNRKDHHLFIDNIFPSMPPELSEVLPKRFHEELMVAYDSLFSQINAGLPPTTQVLANELRRAESNFISQSVQKNSRADLTEEETQELTRKLGKIRLGKNREHAQNIEIYINKDEALLHIPVWDQSLIPTESYMFIWNWEYWVTHDILMALHHANEKSETVLLAPVKRLLSLTINDMPVVPQYASPSSRLGGGGVMGSTGGGKTVSDNDTEDAASGGLIDPSQPVAPDYSFRFTGRNSNALYDVYPIDLELIVDSTRIPEILDAIAQENFFTITDLSIRPADPFFAASEGYMYGLAPVCYLDLTVETVWLRQWTSEKMPEAGKKALGISVALPTPEDD